MLELTISCNCRICNEPVEIKSIQNGGHLFTMADNNTRETPFFAYHHEGFGEDQDFAVGQCEKCGANYTVLSGVISVICNSEFVDDEFIKEVQPEPCYISSQITFPKWLKLQQHRPDSVGDLARESYHSEGTKRDSKKDLDEKFPGRPKIATEYDEWVKFLKGSQDALNAFYMAWAEYQLLKGYGQYK